MKVKYTADCLDATYDPDTECLVLFCFMRDINAKKVISFSKDDFTFRGKKPVPDEEMYKTAQLWKGKPFFFEMDDDPNRDLGESGEGMTDEEYFLHEKVYMGEIGARMYEAGEKMNSDEWILQQKTARLLTKEAEIRRKLKSHED